MKRKNKVATYMRVGSKEQITGCHEDFVAEVKKYIEPHREQLMQQVRESLDKKSKRL